MTEVSDEVVRLIFAYADALDAGDFDAVGQLFERGELWGSAGSRATLRGSAAVSSYLSSRVITDGAGSPRTKHLTSNIVVDFDRAQEVAWARSYFAVLQPNPTEGRVEVIAAGRYEDVFARDDTEWRFERRIIHREMSGDLSRHLH